MKAKYVVQECYKTEDKKQQKKKVIELIKKQIVRMKGE